MERAAFVSHQPGGDVFRDGAVVDDPGRGDVKTCDSRDVRLERAKPARVEEGAIHSVRGRAFAERVEPSAFVVRSSDDELPAPVVLKAQQ